MSCFRSFLFLIYFFTPMFAWSEYWNLPETLSQANSEVSFEVDSTWHLIEGKAKKVRGNLWLSNPKDFHSVRGVVEFPISDFDTDNESRDERLREVMNSERYPNVKFELTSFGENICNPEMMANDEACSFEAFGDLTMNNITRKIILNSKITKDDESYIFSGDTLIKWRDFNVEDPSILIARLHDEVKIHVTLHLSPVGK